MPRGMCTCIGMGFLIVKWDLDNNQPMIGKATRRLRALIEALDSEGVL